MSEKRCYTVKELQEILGVSRPTIYNLLKKMNIGEYEELIKEVLGDEYMDYNLVMASTFDLPLGGWRDPEGVDAELLAKVLNNPEMAALLTSLAKTMK